MNLPITVNQQELLEILLNIAPVRPVYIWGAPGIGKSALVEEFAMEVGLECVSSLGSQLAPEDIIGIPQIRGETSIGEYHLPEGSIVIGAGNRTQDEAIVKTMSSALMKFINVHLPEAVNRTADPELKRILAGIKGSYADFVIGMLEMIYRRPEKRQELIDYIETHPDTSSSDVVGYVSGWEKPEVEKNGES